MKVSSVDAAYEILKENKRPMRTQEIINIAISEYGVVMEGRTPEATLYSNITNEIKRRNKRGRSQRFVRISPGKWGLVEYLDKYYSIQEGTTQPHE